MSSIPGVIPAVPVPSRSLTSYVVLGVSLFLLLVIFRETATSILIAWQRNPLGHGYVVLPAALYIGWTRRRQVELLGTAPSFWWLPILAIVAAIWLFGHLGTVIVVQQICLVVMIVGFIWGVLGTSAVSPLIFSLGFLVFALPLGDWFVPSLQDLTARFAVQLLRWSDVPVLLQSHMISIPGSRWEVAAACSGINYLMASLVIAYLYAGLTYRSSLRRVGFFLAAAAMALFANALRVYVTIFAASMGASAVASGLHHYVMGWVVFAIIMGGLFATCGRWSEEADVQDATIPRDQVLQVPAGRSRTYAFALAALLVVALAPLSAKNLLAGDDSVESRSAGILAVSTPWSRLDVPQPRWRTGMTASAPWSGAIYQRGRQSVQLEFAHYDPRSGSTRADEMVTRPGDSLLSTQDRVITIDGRSVPLTEIVLASGQSSTVVWTWYSVSGSFAASRYIAKIELARSRLLGTGQTPLVIAVTTEAQPGDDIDALLRDFVAHVSIRRVAVSGKSDLPLSSNES